MILGVTGHRPKGLPWGYNENLQSCKKFKHELCEYLENLIKGGFNHFIFGLALGIDMLFAEIIIKLKEKYDNIILEGAIPCENQSIKWSQKEKDRYKSIVSNCDIIRYISKNYTSTCMQERNKYIVDKCDMLLAIWNGKPSGTRNTIHMAQSKGCHIKIINPFA